MYEKFANWKNFPDKSTPITAAALTHIEQGITDVDVTRPGTPAEVELSSRLSGVAGSAEGLVQAERAAREAALALKADSGEMIDALGLKANASAVYTKAQSDTALGLKANSADVYPKNAVYTKGEVESGLGLKANKTDVYTKAETYTRAETGTQITNAITASRPPLYGTGFPNGKVAAPVGTLYADEAVTNGASLWQKITGTGNTGWQVVRGDTGQRQCRDSLDPTKVDATKAPSLLVSRTNGVVSYIFTGVPLVTNEIIIPTILGMRLGGARGVGVQETSPARPVVVVGAVDGVSIFGAVADGSKLTFSITERARGDEPWPATLPGTN